MEQRGATEVDVSAILEKATAFEPTVVEGRMMSPSSPPPYN